jgi:hypothetical protein
MFIDVSTLYTSDMLIKNEFVKKIALIFRLNIIIDICEEETKSKDPRQGHPQKFFSGGGSEKIIL